MVYMLLCSCGSQLPVIYLVYCILFAAPDLSALRGTVDVLTDVLLNILSFVGVLTPGRLVRSCSYWCFGKSECLQL
jgi:hypothetical protein